MRSARGARRAAIRGSEDTARQASFELARRSVASGGGPSDPRRREPSAAVARESDVGRIEPHSIPQLARDLAMRLVQRLAVVRERAPPHLPAQAKAHLQE